MSYTVVVYIRSNLFSAKIKLYKQDKFSFSFSKKIFPLVETLWKQSIGETKPNLKLKGNKLVSLWQLNLFCFRRFFAGKHLNSKKLIRCSAKENYWRSMRFDRSYR